MDSKPPETERLLMSANLHRIRGEFNEAEAMVRAALQRNPGDAYAQEFLGDLLAQKGDFKGAEAAYRAILQDSPGRGSVEEKLARLILKSTPFVATTATGSALRTDRKPFTVLILSLMFPGVGHFYMGDKVKGLLFSVGMALLSFAAIPAMISALGPVFSAYNQGLSAEGFESGSLQSPHMSLGMGAQLGIVSLLTTLLYIYAAIDSFVVARKAYRP